MKNMFKLAAIAVSMALVTSLVACSSGDDDVVDATTPKYLVTAQIDKYVASIKYNQNVSDEKINGLKDAHKAMMKIIGDCADCLEVYFSGTDGEGGLKSKASVEEDKALTSEAVDTLTEELKTMKANCKDDHKEYHKVEVYKPAIDTALNAVDKKYVAAIGDPNGNTIVKGELNERQAANMNAYIDAVKALKAVLSEDDSETCEEKIKDADDAIAAFNKLVEKKTVTKSGKDGIDNVIEKVDAMCEDIRTNVYDKINYKK